MESRLYTQYKNKAVPALKEVFGYNNIMQVPRVEKVVLNVGYGRHTKDKAYIENVEKTLMAITGQKPVSNKAKKSISNFKIRQGMDVGASVTLRGKRMYDFLDKLANVTFPRVRDFRGISPKAFDKQGNYAIGFKENIAFPEINADAIEKIHGLEVVITTTATNREEGLALLKALGFPFKEK
jgi:large subunit ribosomal protein L5